MAGAYSLGEAVGTIVIAYDGKGVKAAQAGLAGVEARSKSTMATATKVGKSMTKAGLIMAAGLGVAIKQATDFQSKMNLLVTAAGEAPSAIEQVAKGLQDIAIKTGTSLDQMADGMYLAEKAGYRAANGLKVMMAAAEGARAENVDLATFTSALTSIMTSYSYKADDAVKVTNMLVRAAGASKTTMQEFAGSLATVLPIASALKISFPEVAGAISVLTQHGTSAREATMELANLIRNLAGQNNVAKGAMEQLGIKVIDLQRNLGKRGLSGTLAIVTEALKDHGKAGMIVTSAFKQSATATAAMDTMLKKMPPDAKKLTESFVDGKKSLQDFRTEGKGLSGQSAVMAGQFLALYQRSKGFSDALRSGNPQVQTLAQTLQKALGGATGLRTALQLGVSTSDDASKSASLFAQNVKDIGDAGKDSGKDIETWAKTSETAAVKLGRLKAAGEVFAVMMGNVVLPAVTTVVDALTKFLGWLTDLPEPMKKMLGYGTLIAAVFLLLGGLVIKLVEFGVKFYKTMKLMGRGISSTLGAIRSLLVRLGLMTTAESEAAAAAALAAEEQEAAAAAVTVAYEESVAAVEAAQVRLAEAQAAAAEVATASAAEQEEAAALVAAAQENLANVATISEDRVAAAELAAAEAAQRAAVLTEEAMAAQTAAVESGARAQQAALGSLAATRAGTAGGAVGGFGRFSKAGLGLGLVGTVGGGMLAQRGGTVGAVGNTLQYAGMGALAGSFFGPEGALVGAGIGTIISMFHHASDATDESNAKAAAYFTLLQSQADEAKTHMESLTASIDTQSAAYGKNVRAQIAAFLERGTIRGVGKGATAAALRLGIDPKQLTAAVSGNQKALDAVSRATAIPLGTSTAQQRKDVELVAQAINQETEALHKAAAQADLTAAATGDLDLTNRSAAAQIRRVGAALSGNSDAAADNHLWIKRNVEALANWAHTEVAAGKNVDAVSNKLLGQINSFRRNAVQAGFNRKEVSNLIKTYFHIPDNVLTKLKADPSDANTKIATTLYKLGLIPPDKLIDILGKDQASAIIDRIRNELATLHDQTVHIRTVHEIVTSSTHYRTKYGGRQHGGWVPGSSTTAWRGEVHGKEYVLSRSMLRGRQAVDERVLRALSIGQRHAMAARHPSRVADVMSQAPRVTLKAASSGPRGIRITGGTIGIGRDATGELRAWVQDLMAEEQDFRDSLAGMAG